jgi:hypothetical protein
MWDALSNVVELNLIINNRAAGNAPLLAQRIIGEFVEMGRKRREAGP